jgi:hypothetical protein
MEFKLLEVSGIVSAIKGMRYPTKTVGGTHIDEKNDIIIGEDDKKLIRYLLNKREVVDNREYFKGDTHGKFQRGIVAWFDIDVPRYIWSELDTYSVGMNPISSESTMYTLIKESADITYDMFSEYTPKRMVDAFKETVEELTEKYGSRAEIPIVEIKAALPEGWMQGRIRTYTYQTLRRIYVDRHNHRLPEWSYICEKISKLPYADLLIFGY